MQKNYKDLYNETDRGIMRVAEDALNPKLDRVEEIVAFAREAGMQRMGIANCITFNRESEALEKYLKQEGFEVTRVHCKVGKMPTDDILPGYKGVACNPAGQAFALNQANTDLNLVVGLCIGHDIVFNQKSAAPLSTLVVKDRKLHHNTYSKLREARDVNHIG